MDKQVECINVYNGVYEDKPIIVIRQPQTMADDEMVFIHPEQVDLLIYWLKEAQKEYFTSKE